MPVKYISEIPYDSVTDNQVELSTETSLDSFYRSIRAGDDNVLVEYRKEHSGAFNAYDSLTDSLDTLSLKSAYNNLGLNESRLVEIRSTDFELSNHGNIAFNGEISDVIILSGGKEYSSNGEIYTEDSYGSGFKATYIADENGTITSITIINNGSGYTNPPTLYITPNTAYTEKVNLLPILATSADENNKVVIPLQLKEENKFYNKVSGEVNILEKEIKAYAIDTSLIEEGSILSIEKGGEMIIASTHEDTVLKKQIQRIDNLYNWGRVTFGGIPYGLNDFF